MGIALQRRRRLRRDATDAENLLWHQLRGRRFRGFKFRRQHARAGFILDFFCAQRRLGIELDGGQHFERPVRDYDLWRGAILRVDGITVLRFNNDDVFLHTEAVLEVIAHALGEPPSPRPSPRQTGERESEPSERAEHTEHAE